MRVDVAIIGGGLSGLAAAVELASRGVKVALFEQSPRLGGRCYSYVDTTTGDIVDNGQHVLLGAYHNVLDYLDRIGTRKFLKSEPAFRLPFHHPTKGFAHCQLPALPKLLSLSAGILSCRLLPFADRMNVVRIALSLRGSNDDLGRKLRSLTVEEWLRQAGQSAEACRSLWYPIAISIMNESPGKASALLFARSLRGAFLGEKSDSTILLPQVGQTELYVKGAEDYFRQSGTAVYLNAEVESLEVSGSTAVGVRLKNGQTIQSTFVISSIPYYALSKLIPSSFLNEKPFADLGKFASSPIVSIHLWYDSDFMEMEYLGLIDKTLQWIFNRRLITGENKKGGGYLSAVISGAHEFVDMTKEELVKLALRDVQTVFPRSASARLTSSIVIKEKRATFSPTCEIESMRPTAETPIENFFLAGDWTNTGLPATIEGAVMSGYTAARIIL